MAAVMLLSHVQRMQAVLAAEEWCMLLIRYLDKARLLSREEGPDGSNLLLPMSEPRDAADVALTGSVCCLMRCVALALLRGLAALAGLATFRPSQQA